MTEEKMILKSQQGELDAVLMYNALAKTVKDPKDAETFRRLAADEGRHASVFKNISGQKLTARKGKAILLPILYTILGKKILYPFIANGEYDAVRTYEQLVGKYPEVKGVQEDEQRHGDIVMGMLNEAK